MSVGGRELDLGQGPGPSPGPPTTSPTCPTIPCPSQTCPTCQPAVPCPTCPTTFNRTWPSRTALQTADDNHAQQLVSSAVQIKHLQVFIGGGATISLHQLPPDEAEERIHKLLSFQIPASDQWRYWRLRCLLCLRCCCSCCPCCRCLCSLRWIGYTSCSATSGLSGAIGGQGAPAFLEFLTFPRPQKAAIKAARTTGKKLVW